MGIIISYSCIVKDNKVTYYTRNGKEINPKKIPAEVARILNVPEMQGLVFDGELMSKSFQELMHMMTKKYHIEAKDIYYAIFDVIPYDEFVKGETKFSYARQIKAGAKVGKSNGLTLLLDAEIYDYSFHRHASEGFKIAVQHHLDQPLMSIKELDISPGFESQVLSIIS